MLVNNIRFTGFSNLSLRIKGCWQYNTRNTVKFCIPLVSQRGTRPYGPIFFNVTGSFRKFDKLHGLWPIPNPLLSLLEFRYQQSVISLPQSNPWIELTLNICSLILCIRNSSVQFETSIHTVSWYWYVLCKRHCHFEKTAHTDYMLQISHCWSGCLF